MIRELFCFINGSLKMRKMRLLRKEDLVLMQGSKNVCVRVKNFRPWFYIN